MSWGGTFGNVDKDKELFIGAQAFFINSTSKGLIPSKERKIKFSFPVIVTYELALAICGIPLTTRSGIEVEHFSPVAMYLSRRINLVHSIFFRVDIHCYVCVKSIHFCKFNFNITFVINLIFVYDFCVFSAFITNW